MKAHLGLMVCLIACGLACSPGADLSQAAPGIELSGSVALDGVSEIVLNGAPPKIDDGWSVRVDPSERRIPLADDGTFRLDLPADEAGFYRIGIGRTEVEVFLEPGRSTHLVAEGEDLRFEGESASYQDFLRQQAEAMAAVEADFEQTFREIYRLSLEAFEERLATEQQPLLDRHAAFLASHPEASSAFGERTRADATSWFRMVRLYYPWYHAWLAAKPALVPPDYLETVVGQTLSNGDLLSSRQFVRFLDTYVDKVTRGGLAAASLDAPTELILSRFEAIESLAAAEPIRAYLVDQMFDTFRTNYGVEDWRPVFDRLVASGEYPEVIERVRPLLEEDLAVRERPDEIVVFRDVGGVTLEAHVFLPEDEVSGAPRPAYLFFHGGGWSIGTPEWGYRTCEEMAALGMVAISFEYRLGDIHESLIPQSIDDVAEAIRWARDPEAGGGRFGIDPDRVVASGFSAGGHLAAAASLQLQTEDPALQPNVLVLHSSSYNLTKGKFFRARSGPGGPESISLFHQARPGLAPALLLHGSADHLAPQSEFDEFVARMEELGNDFEPHLFEGIGHFFRNPEARERADRLEKEFLIQRGILEGAAGREGAGD